ncbi:efflux RND transporter periplasmic adaptor subunit [uncultured Shewanella sp.]|uniref:efflux RND transporter periplasmic adaptor subunit n=1 Tax=uncultured Shewanella sp. TaxID=173975 RepID=UPI002605A6E8|nr:efflux RND transporter periplasmic adaptor subunit [uncultured Shewanella sp.]
MKNYRWLVTITTILVASFSIASYKNDLQAAHAQQNAGEQAATVEAMHVLQVPHQQTTSVSGISQSMQIIKVSNELAGKITQLNFASGEYVKKGQILLELDHSQEKAQLIAAKAKLSLAKKMLHRYKILQKSQKISEDIVDKAIAELRITESNLAVLESTISKKIIRAPFRAKAGIHNLQVGQYIESNSQITHLIGINQYSWIDFSVPQVYAELKAGALVSVSLNGHNQATAFAEIVSAEAMLTHGSRHLKYRAKIANEELFLKHNQLVKVTIPITEKSQKIIIPNLAIIKSQIGDYVYILKEEDGIHRAHKQTVTLGERIGDQVIVEQGLKLGDYIANKGAFKLRPGLKTFISPSETLISEVKI